MNREELLDSIRELRRENYSYQFIGDTLGIPMNTVKSTCRRYGFVAVEPFKSKEEKAHAPICKYCHKLLPKSNRGKSFCSATCRAKWWREQRTISIIPSTKGMDNS